MQKFIVSHIDAHMGRTSSAGRKEDEVSHFQLIPVNFFSLLVLLARGAGQFNIELGEQVLYQTGAVKTGLFGTSAAPVANPDHLESGFHETQARGWRFLIRYQILVFQLRDILGGDLLVPRRIWHLSWRVPCLDAATWEPGMTSFCPALIFEPFNPLAALSAFGCGLIIPGDLDEIVSLPDHVGLIGIQRGFGRRAGLAFFIFEEDLA